MGCSASGTATLLQARVLKKTARNPVFGPYAVKAFLGKNKVSVGVSPHLHFHREKLPTCYP